MNKKGLILLVSGFSGVGKGTVVKRLLQKYDNYALSVSATTRQPREGEENGREYFFVSEETFAEMEAEDRLLESAGYVGHHYGTPRDYVLEKINSGQDIILEIEMQGALKVKEKYPEAVMVFVVPPSAADLKNRLTGRGTESAEVIEKRMRRAVEEAEYMKQYEYLLVNDELENCVDELHALVQSVHKRVSLNQDMIAYITNDLNAYVEGE